jgi:hypothetical protein
LRNTPIAGPPRAPRPKVGAEDAARARQRRLASLDFEEGSLRDARQSLEATQPGRRARMQRIRWFAYGIVVGTLGASLGGGGAEALCRVMRDVGARAVRTSDSRPAAPDPPAAVPTVRVDDLPPAARDPGRDPRSSTRAP